MICNYLFSSTINEYPCQPNFSFVSAPEEFCCREEAFIWCRAGEREVWRLPSRPPGLCWPFGRKHLAAVFGK